MDELRIILLLVGALFIGGVYLYSRRGTAAGRREPFEAETPTAAKREPGLHQEPAFDEELDELPRLHPVSGVDEPVSATSAHGAHPEAQPATRDAQMSRQSGQTNMPTSHPVNGEEKIIVLNILPRDSDKRFLGNDLLDVFDRAGLEYGRFDVFHRMKDTADEPQSVFVVASATEPGSFDVTEMADQSFKGLSMFMMLPGPVRGVDGFADMLATARRIAQQLDADVKDRNRSTLTKQTAHHIREDIIAFEHRIHQQHS